LKQIKVGFHKLHRREITATMGTCGPVIAYRMFFQRKVGTFRKKFLKR